jgi:hypothetical protein
LARSGRPLPALAGILASHPLLHTAEGEMFRDALRRGAERCGLRVCAVRQRDAYDHAAEMLGMKAAGVRDRIAALGREVGPPWSEDQKLAAVAAWVFLRTRELRDPAQVVWQT